jgi:hypothetical protein
MTVTQKHHRACAGTSFTKAVALCRVSMCPVSHIWSKQQQTGSGFQA